MSYGRVGIIHFFQDETIKLSAHFNLTTLPKTILRNFSRKTSRIAAEM